LRKGHKTSTFSECWAFELEQLLGPDECVSTASVANQAARSAAACEGEAAAEAKLSKPLSAISQEAHWHPQKMPYISYQEIDSGGGRQFKNVQCQQPNHPQTMLDQFVEGYRVRIQELVGAQQHNGKVGVLKSFIEETQRWLFPSLFIFL
jgi:hypothetical protein